MAKRKSQRPKPGSERTRQFFSNLEQYDDFTRHSLQDFPLHLPSQFSLKIGQVTVGRVSVDWTEIRATTLGQILANIKSVPLEQSPFHWLDYLASPKSSEKEKSDILFVLFGTLMYMCEHLPEKMNSANMALWLEAGQNVVIVRGKVAGRTDIPSPTEFAKWIAKLEKDATKRRLPEPRGGDKKTKPDWKSPASLEAYARRVEDLKPLVRQLKHVFSECLEDEGWITDLKADRTYLALSQGIPEKALKWAITRTADGNASEAEREPQAIACEMARQELNLTFIEMPTQQEKYRAGKALIRKSRSPSRESSESN